MKNIPYVQQNKVPEIRALWDEAFIFRALPHIFGAKSIQPPPKMARTPMVSIRLFLIQCSVPLVKKFLIFKIRCLSICEKILQMHRLITRKIVFTVPPCTPHTMIAYLAKFSGPTAADGRQYRRWAA